MSVPAVYVDQPEQGQSYPIRLKLPAAEANLPFGDIFVKMYEHMEELRNNEHHEEAAKIDNNLKVSALVFTQDHTGNPFDVI